MTTQTQEPKIVSKPAFAVVGMLGRYLPKDPRISQLWQDFGGQVQRVRGQVNPGVFYGVMDNYDPPTGQFDYVACVEVEEGQTAPEGMVAWQIPAQTYAVIETTLPDLGEAFDYVYGQWLPGSRYARTAGPEFELYDSDFSPADPSSRMYLYVPVTAK